MFLKKDIYIFSKTPRIGTNKTRLAKDLGEVNTLRFTRNNIDNLLIRLNLIKNYNTILALSPNKTKYRTFKNLKINKIIDQGRGNIGKRIWTLKNNSGKPMVIIGSDIPYIKTEHISFFRTINK